MQRFLFGVGVAAALAMIGFGVDSGPSATAAPTDPGLPTIHTAPSTYIVNGDGTRNGCTSSLRYCWPGG